MKDEKQAVDSPTVLLVGTTRAASIGLRTIIGESRELRLVAEVADGASAVSAARQHHPDHIVVAMDGLTPAEIGQLHELREASPGSTLTVCTFELDPKNIASALLVPALGVLAWPDATAETLHSALASNCVGLYTLSSAVAQATARPSRHSGDSLQFTYNERTLLRCLEDDLTATADIVRRTGMGRRTVQRTFDSLAGKLQVHGPYKLGRRIEALGIHLGNLEFPVRLKIGKDRT
jgi:DNA-binding NarL/FixJ family response regulator